MEKKTVIFFGMSGSGKGTQADKLVAFLKEQAPSREVIYIETGKRFREFADGNSFTQKKTRAVMEEGGLMPAFMPIYMWTSMLVERLTGEEHLVLDGLARKPHEAPILEEAMRFYERVPVDIVYLELPEEVAYTRLCERHRSDDSDGSITKRLNWFKKDVVPSMNHFRDKEGFNFYDIDGSRDIDAVFSDILKQLKLQ
ncbi:hypothetical protein COU17_01630 [Candidatus Kaiserbacteria bacterium CG10_big_fil_rev_8_21_14_0_10_49_17]|uniref:Adenylate kinase n=1 Tax=Candidatus Kaiserbacteria bacterium CG10_big_fil_rev_8_21_14_0_10_49_17 TaxID=1974609 RepID=A0A2M6WEG2_9BACT|nr:MAG: hypothetical protein COU17_01630 [Candidatus Kaiserbacteria bacterium CG10_big_fil_rev_8_21_14_0_10_49_17]